MKENSQLFTFGHHIFLELYVQVCKTNQVHHQLVKILVVWIRTLTHLLFSKVILQCIDKPKDTIKLLSYAVKHLFCISFHFLSVTSTVVIYFLCQMHHKHSMARYIHYLVQIKIYDYTFFNINCDENKIANQKYFY